MSLSESEKHAVRHYKYCGGDSSPVYAAVLSPWAQFCVDTFVPLSMAPNTITLTGLVMSLLATTLTLIYNPTLAPGGPRWLHVVTGVSMFAYQTLDNMDGKQARRTGSSSALGMFFDHACDSINAGVTIIAMGSVLGTGWTPLLFITYLASFIPFYLQTWEEYYSRTMILPPFNGPSEGLLMSMGLCFASALYGSELFHEAVMDAPAVLIQADDSFFFRCELGFQSHPILLIIMHCSVFAEMVMHIMVAHLVERKVSIVERYGVWVFAVITYLGVYGGEAYRSLEYALLIFNTGLSAVLMLNTFILFAATLNISVFKINPKQ
eukprot:gene14040-10032_t